MDPQRNLSPVGQFTFNFLQGSPCFTFFSPFSYFSFSLPSTSYKVVPVLLSLHSSLIFPSVYLQTQLLTRWSLFYFLFNLRIFFLQFTFKLILLQDGPCFTFSSPFFCTSFSLPSNSSFYKTVPGLLSIHPSLIFPFSLLTFSSSSSYI